MIPKSILDYVENFNYREENWLWKLHIKYMENT